MSEHPLQNTLSRREALKVIAGSVSVAVGCPALRIAVASDAAGSESSAYSPKFFNSEQMQSLDALSEVIIPQDEHSPGAHAARINEYMDVVISGSSQKEQLLWQEGLAAIDKVAQLRSGKRFRDCSSEEQRRVVEQISEHEDDPTTIEQRFFVAVKKSTVDGYYTSEIGIHQDLEYRGNDMLLDFPGCKREGHDS